MFTILVALAVLTQVVLALTVYSRRNRSQANTFFVLLSLAIASWALTDYIAISVTQNNETIYAIRTVLTLVVVQNTLFYLFGATFPNKTFKQLSRWKWPLIGYSLLVAIATQTPLIFTSVTISNGTANPNPTPGIMLFVLQAVVTIALGLAGLRKTYRAGDSAQRRQLSLILFASVVLVLLAPVTNFVMTLALHTTIFVRFGSFYTLGFSAIIAYAIISQHLFDVRAAVARSVGYLLIIGAMTTVYGLGVFVIVDGLVRGSDHELLRQILSVVLITPLAFSFQSLRSYFDRVSTRLFYRDHYDIQDILDQLGRVAITEIELYKILSATRNVLGTPLKASFMEFLLIKNQRPYFEAHTQKVIDHDLLQLSPVIHQQHRKVLITDDMSAQNPLKQALRQANVAVSLRLKAHDQVVGYILFGDKRSGNSYSRQDEKLLLIAANELSVAIQNALRFQEIENFNLTLQAKIDAATRKMRLSNEKLKVLDQSKDDFVSMASHQLRTPLTSIKGYTSMVLEGDAGAINATQRKLLEQSMVSSQRMVYLIADLLNVSRLKTGKFIIESAPVNLAEVVQQELGQLQAAAASRSLTLTYHKPASFPTLLLDETKTRQVIMNFVDNAVYYTPAGGNIEVKLVETPASVELRVIDTGIGVPKSEQPHLFTKFYRAGNARKARPDGTGLGLFMAKKVIVAQGGAIIFESVEGKGSTFGFMIPKPKVPVTAKPAGLAGSKLAEVTTQSAKS